MVERQTTTASARWHPWARNHRRRLTSGRGAPRPSSNEKRADRPAARTPAHEHSDSGQGGRSPEGTRLGSEPPRRKLGYGGPRHGPLDMRPSTPPKLGHARPSRLLRVPPVQRFGFPRGPRRSRRRLVALNTCLAQIKSLRRNLSHGFYDIGLVLRDIQARKLYEARGFGTFEDFSIEKWISERPRPCALSIWSRCSRKTRLSSMALIASCKP